VNERSVGLLYYYLSCFVNSFIWNPRRAGSPHAYRRKYFIYLILQRLKYSIFSDMESASCRDPYRAQELKKPSERLDNKKQAVILFFDRALARQPKS